LIPRFSFEARVLEKQFVLSHVSILPSRRILDIGCVESELPRRMAQHKHAVYGIDLRACSDPSGFVFVTGDLERLPFRDSVFDIVTDVSTLEHVGLGRYGDALSPDGDKKALREVGRVLKPAGLLLATIPCGPDTICYSKQGIPLHRAYSPSGLVKLLSSFEILELSYIIKRDPVWMPGSATDAMQAAQKTPADRVGMTAIAFVFARSVAGKW
jgi:SAM-dependent methyltransferase